MAEPYHGGDIYRLARVLGLSPMSILDFSASLNPLALPEAAIEVLARAQSLVRAYPEPWAESLTEAIASRYGIDQKFLLSGPGSCALLYWLASVLRPNRVALFAPTFTEYERAFRASMPEVEFEYINLYPEEEFRPSLGSIEKVLAKVDCLVICNPNNPTGVTMPLENVLRVVSLARELNTKVILDEAFIDFVPGCSALTLVPENPHLVVLRSLTKFYGIAGMRVGFIATAPELLLALKDKMPPWSLSQLSIELTKALVHDIKFQEQTMQWLHQEKAFVEKGLQDLAIRYFPSSVNYYLIETPGAEALWKDLYQKGLLLRKCTDFRGLGQGFLRISLLLRQDNQRLFEEMGRALQKV